MDRPGVLLRGHVSGSHAWVGRGVWLQTVSVSVWLLASTPLGFLSPFGGLTGDPESCFQGTGNPLKDSLGHMDTWLGAPLRDTWSTRSSDCVCMALRLTELPWSEVTTGSLVALTPGPPVPWMSREARSSCMHSQHMGQPRCFPQPVMCPRVGLPGFWMSSMPGPDVTTWHIRSMRVWLGPEGSDQVTSPLGMDGLSPGQPWERFVWPRCAL